MKYSNQQLENIVNTFNLAYQVGDKVEVLKEFNNSEKVFIDTIKSKASILGGHTPVIWLEKKGSYDITFIKGKTGISSELVSEAIGHIEALYAPDSQYETTSAIGKEIMLNSVGGKVGFSNWRNLSDKDLCLLAKANLEYEGELSVSHLFAV